MAETYQWLARLSKAGGKEKQPGAFNRSNAAKVKRMYNLTKVMSLSFESTQKGCLKVLKNTAPEKLKATLDVDALGKRLDLMKKYNSHWGSWFQPIKGSISEQAEKTRKAYRSFNQKYQQVFKDDPFKTLSGSVSGPPFNASDPAANIRRAYEWYLKEIKK